jgi:hypothetical protein
MRLQLPEKFTDLWPVFVLGFLFCLVFFYHDWEHWLAYATGSYNCTPKTCPNGVVHNYNSFSGSLSDVGEYAVATGVFTNAFVIWRAHTCQLHWWCWRHAAHELEGTGHKLCHVHHPDTRHGVKKAVAQYIDNKAAA